MIPYRIDRESMAARSAAERSVAIRTCGASVAAGLTRRRVVDYCRVTAAL